MTTPIRVGLVGAGPWARSVHAPMLAAGPETTLAGVWARRPEAAAALAAAHHVAAFSSFEALLDGCDAVAFAVAPEAQSKLAPVAALHGKALLLEKPLADSLPGARLVAEAVENARVPSMLFLTLRFLRAAIDAIAEAREAKPFAARIAWVSGAFLDGSPFATPWRLERGALLDVGPHALDLAMSLFGPIERLQASGGRHWASVIATHAEGQVSEIALTASVGGGARSTELQVFGERGMTSYDLTRGADPHVIPALRAGFAEVVHGHRADLPGAAHGLELQKWIAQAESQLTGR